jgi:predicted DNA-binding protein YlxM (UPF0122 family)
MKSGLSKNEIAEKLGISRTALWKKTKKWCLYLWTRRKQNITCNLKDEKILTEKQAFSLFFYWHVSCIIYY